LSAGAQRAILLVEWYNLSALLPVGVAFEELEVLRYGQMVGENGALVLSIEKIIRKIFRI